VHAMMRLPCAPGRAWYTHWLGGLGSTGARRLRVRCELAGGGWCSAVRRVISGGGREGHEGVTHIV
jgi:hypothetical protein